MHLVLSDLQPEAAAALQRGGFLYFWQAEKIAIEAAPLGLSAFWNAYLRVV